MATLVRILRRLSSLFVGLAIAAAMAMPSKGA